MPRLPHLTWYDLTTVPLGEQNITNNISYYYAMFSSLLLWHPGCKYVLKHHQSKWTTVFRFTPLFSLVRCPEDGGDALPRNVNHLQYYTTTCLRRAQFTSHRRENLKPYTPCLRMHRNAANVWPTSWSLRMKRVRNENYTTAWNVQNINHQTTEGRGWTGDLRSATSVPFRRRKKSQLLNPLLLTETVMNYPQWARLCQVQSHGLFLCSKQKELKQPTATLTAPPCHTY
jgi:hypothetical protein